MILYVLNLIFPPFSLNHVCEIKVAYSGGYVYQVAASARSLEVGLRSKRRSYQLTFQVLHS